MHDDTVADDARRALVQDPRRHQMERVLLALDNDCVPGVGAAGHTRADVILAAEHVDELALAFVTPLGAQHDVCLAAVVQVDALLYPVDLGVQAVERLKDNFCLADTQCICVVVRGACGQCRGRTANQHWGPLREPAHEL